MITKAVEADIPFILEMTQACAKAMIAQGIYQWNEHYPSYEAFKNDIDLEQLWVLKEENKIVGSIVVSSVKDEEYNDIVWLTPENKSVYIHRLAVHPDYQGKGLAQQLMNFAENKAQEQGYLSIRLDTFSKNSRNNIFYQRRGYKQLGDVYFPKQSEFPFHCYEFVF